MTELPLVGGAVCLDLVNTTGARASGRPRERLLRYDDLLVWSRRAGLLGTAETRRMRAQAVASPRAAATALGRVRRLREDLFAVFAAVAQRRAVPARAVQRLNAWRRREQARRELTPGPHGVDARLRLAGAALDRMLWPMIDSAISLLMSDRVGLVRRCGECDWLFVDETRTGTRRWCKVQCGNRARARRFYHRRTAGRDPDAS